MTWLICLGSAGFGLVIAWLGLQVARAARGRLRPWALTAALFAGGLPLARAAGSPLALLAGSAIGVGAWLCLVWTLRKVAEHGRSE